MIFINTEEKIDSLDKLFELLFSIESDPPARGYSYLSPVKTYNSLDFTEENIQCYSHRRRSFDDLYEIILTYFPETTEEEAFKFIVNYKRDGYSMRLHYCPDIYRTTCYFIYHGHDNSDRYHLIPDMSVMDNFGTSIYSWADLFQRHYRLDIMQEDLTSSDVEYFLEKQRELELV